MQYLILILYIIGMIISFRFFDTYIVEGRDSENISVLIIMSTWWPIVYIVFIIKAISNYWRKLHGKMPRM